MERLANPDNLRMVSSSQGVTTAAQSSSSQQARSDMNNASGSGGATSSAGTPSTPPRTNTTSGRNTPTTNNRSSTKQPPQQDDKHLPAAVETKTTNSTTTTTTNSLPMPLNLLLQTAYFGIDATARLSKPTLDLSLKVLVPMLNELITHYVPSRITTWLSVGSTSIKNIWNLLRSTTAGQTLVTRSVYVGESITDTCTSNLGRQCVIDGTILLIRVLDAVHTPEVKIVLDQCARVTCRIVDVLACGKAKASYYEIVELVWAAIETGNDDAMITSLAEGCAQICYALENEHITRTNERKSARQGGGAIIGGSAATDAAAAKLSTMTNSRRRERDRRQLGTYPPGRKVVTDYETATGGGGGGKNNNNYQDAWNDGFNIKDSDDDAFGGWVPLQEEEETSSQAEGLYADMENIPINTNDDDKANNEGEDGKNGPPKVVLTNSFEMNHQLLSPKVKDDNKLPRVESDITTEMEDLHCSGDDNNNNESGLLPTNVKGSGKSIQYDEQGEDDKYANNDNNKVNQSNDNDNINSDDNNNVPTFDESIQQFYRRMNEVLVETRKQQKYNTSRVDKKLLKEDRLAKNDKSVQSNTLRESSSSTVLTGGESYYNIYLVLVFGVVAMCTIWFTLGCYGFYVLILGGGSSRRQVYLPPSTAHGKNPELASNIIIQIVTPETMDGISTGSKNSWWSTTSGSKNNNNKNGGVVSITLEDWKKVQQGVASAMAGEL
jgi:hypothetical protein